MEDPAAQLEPPPDSSVFKMGPVQGQASGHNFGLLAIVTFNLMGKSAQGLGQVRIN